MKNLDIRQVLLYEFLRGSSAAEAEGNICSVIGEDHVSKRAVQRCFKKFRERDNNVKNAPRGRHEKVISAEEVKELIESDPHRSSRRWLRN